MLVEFKKVISRKDRIFVKECCGSELFESNIGGNKEENDLIICAGSKRLGVCTLNVVQESIVKYAEPVIFLQHFSIYTQEVFKRLSVTLFDVIGVNFLLIKVYSTNKLMLNLAKNFGFQYCGKVVDVDNSNRDIHFFQLYKTTMKNIFEKEISLL